MIVMSIGFTVSDFISFFCFPSKKFEIYFVIFNLLFKKDKFIIFIYID